MLSDKENTRLSKFLSLVLRHRPEKLGIMLDAQGWTDVDLLLQNAAKAGIPLTPEMLKHIVITNNKKRYSFNEDETRIRANQGHSVTVALGYKEREPPEVLYHGTAKQFVSSILQSGLQKRNRHHVHLSGDKETAFLVGQRHGKPHLFTVQAGQMFRDGYLFYLSANGVWLADNVPPTYLKSYTEE